MSGEIPIGNGLSEDGKWFWDGTDHRQVWEDGGHFWDGRTWKPVPSRAAPDAGIQPVQESVGIGPAPLAGPQLRHSDGLLGTRGSVVVNRRSGKNLITRKEWAKDDLLFYEASPSNVPSIGTAIQPSRRAVSSCPSGMGWQSPVWWALAMRAQMRASNAWSLLASWPQMGSSAASHGQRRRSSPMIASRTARPSSPL